METARDSFFLLFVSILAECTCAVNVNVAVCANHKASWAAVDVATFYLALEYWERGPSSLGGALARPTNPTAFNISVSDVESGCSGRVAFESAIETFNDAAKRPHVINGCVCSGASLSLGRFATAFAVPMLVTASQSSLLSDKVNYKNIFRFCTTELTDADMHSGFISYLGLEKVTVIYVDSERGAKQKDRLLSLPALQSVDSHVVRVPDLDLSQEANVESVKTALRSVLQGESYVLVFYTATSQNTFAVPFVTAANDIGIFNGHSIVLYPETMVGQVPDPTVNRLMFGSLMGFAKPVQTYFEAWQAWLRTVTRADLAQRGLPAEISTGVDDMLQDPSSIRAWNAMRFEATFAMLSVMHQLDLAGMNVTSAAIEDGIQNLQMVGIMGNLSWNDKRDRTGMVYNILQVQDLGSANGLVSIGEMVLSPGEDGLFKVNANTSLLVYPGVQPGQPMAFKEAPRCPDGFSKPYPFAMTSLCTACPVGTASSAETAGVCQLCSVGLFGAEPQQGRCFPCKSGQYANATGSTACTNCTSGSAQSTSGSTACASCAPGRAADTSGASVCAWCPKGTFQPQEGQSTCRSCQDVLPESITSSRGAEMQADCECDRGHFLTALTADAQPSCSPCQEWLQCLGGNGAPLSGPLFFVGSQDFPGALPRTIVRCTDATTCPGGLPLNTCPPHRTGLACDVCEVGYADDGGICKPCELKDTAVVAAIVIPLLLLTVVCLVLYSLRESSVKRENLMMIVLTGGLALNALQTLSSFSRITVQWIEPMKSLAQMLTMLAFDISILNPGCFFTTNSPLTVFILSILAYPLVALLLTGGFATMRFVAKRRVDPNRFFNAHGFVMMACFLPITLAALMPWQCEANPDRSTSVAQKRSVVCWQTEEHAAMIGISAAALLLLVAGFGATILTATLLYPSIVLRPGGIGFLRRFDFLFGRFEPSRYYYGIIFILRSFLIAILPVLLVNYVQAQVMTLAIVIAWSLVYESYVKPWRLPLSNIVSSAFSFGLLMIMVGGAMLVDFTEEGSQTVLQVLFVAVFVMAFMAGVLVAGLAVFRILCPRPAYGAFICHHKGGAGVLARVIHTVYSNSTGECVFIDSDHLDNLDLLFSIVAQDVRNLVVIWTHQVLSRMWCAGEITSAIHCKVKIVPIICNDRLVPDDEYIRGLKDMWTYQERSQLSALGIEVKDIQEAYKHFRTLEGFKLDRAAPASDQEDAIRESMRKCVGLRTRGVMDGMVHSSSVMFKRDAEKVGPIVICGYAGEPEASSACVLVRLLLEQLFHIEAVVLDVADAVAIFKRCTHVVAMLSQGVLSQPPFAACLLNAQENGVPVIPVNADPSFTFPGEVFWQGLLSGTVLDMDHHMLQRFEAEDVVSVYKAMFKDIAKTLSTHASERILRAQVEDIHRRFLTSPFRQRSVESSQWKKALTSSLEQLEMDDEEGWDEGVAGDVGMLKVNRGLAIVKPAYI